jgi:hypothetical protein
MPYLTSLWSGIHHVYPIGTLHMYDYNPWSDVFFLTFFCKANPGFVALKIMQLLNCFD